MAIMLQNFTYCHHQIVDFNCLCLYGLLILTNILVCSHQQTITLFDYSQEDSDTNCTDGLLSDVDTVVFKSIVEYSQDPSMELVFFFIKRKLDEIFVFEKQYNIQNDCQGVKSGDCRRLDEHTVEIYLNIKASKDISGARLRGKLITSSHNDIYSEDQIIPEIYDSKDHNRVLVINGEKQTSDNDGCNYNVSDSDLSIFFVLESKLSPFFIEMSSKVPYIHVQGKGHVEYHLKTKVSVIFNITVAYCPCRMEVNVNTIRCNIQIAHAEKLSFVSPETCRDNRTTFYTIFVILIIFIVGIVSITAFSKMRDCKTRSNTDILDQGTGPKIKPDLRPQPITESVGLTTICENDASCHTVKEHMHKCTMEIVYNDYENKHDTKIEEEPVEKQETEPLMQPYDKTKGSPLPKEDLCENKEEEANAAHTIHMSMNRLSSRTGLGNTERHRNRRTLNENNQEEILENFNVQKK